MTRRCGGCEGKGAHWRWCPRIVGQAASWIGQYAQQAEDLADSVGANEPDAANMLYGAAGRLRALAEQRSLEFQSRVIRGIDGRPVEDVDLP